MINAFEVLGKAAFRRWPLGEKKQRGPINRAVFESQSIPLADYRPLDYLRAHKDEIVTTHTRASDEIPRAHREQGRPDHVLLKLTSTVADQTPGMPAVKTTASSGQDIR